MATYQLPPEPDGPLWDKAGYKWVRSKENMWYGGINGVYRVWGDVVHYYGPLTTTPPIKVGDKIGNLEQYVELPEKSVVAVAGSSAIWVKREDGRWESPGKSELRSDSMATGWPVRTVLRVGGGE